jgi:hypothetical protein
MAGIELDGVNQKVVLDSDGDTYLEAATDDTVKIYVAGAHDATISANAINVLSGTTLTIDSGATITNSGTANGFGSNEPSSADGQALGSASAEWSDLFLADGGIIKFGNDQDTLLTHTDGTGLTLNSTNKLCFGDAASYIHQSSDGVLKIDGEATVDIDATTAVTIAAANVPVTVGGIPFYYGDTGSIYTHNVSGTDDTAQYNTAYGLTALDAITTGDNNTAVGHNAGGAMTTGGNNVMIGKDAVGSGVMTGSFNVLIGKSAGTAMTSGAGVVAIGYNAGLANTTGPDNIFIGYDAGKVNTTGSANTVIGDQAYINADAEGNNLAIGKDALGGTIAGAEQNVMVGGYAGDAITSGDANCSVGYVSGSAITTGASNTSVGTSTLHNLTTGNYNVGIGNSIGVSAVDQEYGIGLGYSVTVAANDFSFGKASNVVTNDFDADANWSRSSDVRKKREIYDQELGLDFINDLRTVRFQWKPSNEFPKEWNDYSEENNMDTDVIMHGFIAQEVKEALDKHASDNDKKFSGWKEGDDGMQHTSREMFVIPLIKAVQELTAQVSTLQNEVKTLKGE